MSWNVSVYERSRCDRARRVSCDRSRALLAVVVTWLCMACAIAGLARKTAAAPVDCVQILREANRMSQENKGRAPALGPLAKRVGAPAAFVERCLHTFGRRVRREGVESRESSEALLEQLEGEELEESFPEDVEEPGAVERPKREPRPRYLSIRPTPGTMEGGDLLPGEWERHQETLEREREP